jgi:hypothetical protein
LGYSGAGKLNQERRDGFLRHSTTDDERLPSGSADLDGCRGKDVPKRPWGYRQRFGSSGDSIWRDGEICIGEWLGFRTDASDSDCGGAVTSPSATGRLVPLIA